VANWNEPERLEPERGIKRPFGERIQSTPGLGPSLSLPVASIGSLVEAVNFEVKHFNPSWGSMLNVVAFAFPKALSHIHLIRDSCR